MKGKYYAYKQYKTYILRSTKTPSCSLCHQKMFPRYYEKHCTDMHLIQAKTRCVWCKKFSWPNKQKYKFGDHLLMCARNYIESPIENNSFIQERPLPISYTLLNTQSTFKAKHFFHFSKIPRLTQRAYKPIWPLALNPMRLTYQHDALNLAVATVQKFLEIQNDTEWFHVMVRAPALESFVQSLDEEGGRTRTLNIFCWCNGGKHPDPYYRHHRHMIVIAPIDHFETNVWKKVEPSSIPYPTYKCKLLKKIDSPHYLSNAILYLSNRKSRCNFSFQLSKEENMNHFYIWAPLPSEYLLVLVLQWNGGIIEWIHQKCENISMKQWSAVPVQRIHGKWGIAMGDTPGIPQNTIIPISKNFVPTKQVTDYFFHLTDDKKMYFEKLETPLSDDQWIQRQIKGNHLFFHTVTNDMWTPKPTIQKFLNAIQPFKMKISESNTKIDHQKIKMSELVNKINHLETENGELKNKVKDLDTQIYDLRIEILDLKTNINDLKAENNKLNIHTHNNTVFMNPVPMPTVKRRREDV